jgi:hypothetical protein
MPLPGQLIDAIAAAFAVPRPRVFATHRRLREKGLIVTGGRGLAAAKMTSRDAALIVTALAGNKAINESHESIVRPGRFISPRGKWNLTFLPVPELQALPPDHNFIDGLTALIDAGISGSLEKAIIDCPFDAEVEVALRGPIPGATIELRIVHRGDEGEQLIDPSEREEHRYSLLNTWTKKKGNLSPIPIATDTELAPGFSYEFRFGQIEILKLTR